MNFRRRIGGTASWWLLGVCALVSSSCSPEGDGGVLRPLPPTVGVDSVAVSLFTRDGDGQLRLRWVGTPMGPLPASPEQTLEPWVGYGVPFEVHWFIGSRDAPLVGYRYKASQLVHAPFVPAAVDSLPEWADRTAAAFSNAVDPAQLGAPPCPDGEDCPSVRRWPSSDAGPYRFQLEGIDDNGRVQHFEFAFHVNYPPETHLFRNGKPDSQSGVEFPRYWYVDGGGAWVANHFAEGDTIPSGSYAVFAVSGEDRLATVAMTDSFCCDLAASVGAEVVERQWRAEGFALNDRGNQRVLQGRWTAPAAVDTTGFFVGPYDYRVTVRAVDEHGRRDPTPELFEFVGGYAPRISGVVPSSGEAILIGSAGADPASARTVEVTPGVTRYWDPDLDRYYDLDLPGTQAVSGANYALELHFESVADPRQPGPVPLVAGEGFGAAALSWSYRYRSENDPANDILDGDGDGDLRRFVDGRVDGRLERPTAVVIFVPSLLWSSPELYDSSGACPVPEFCDQGDNLKKDLGAIGLEVLAKDTWSASALQSYPATLRPDPGAASLSVDLSELGRRSPIVRADFEIRLVLGGTPGALVLWPPRP